MRQVEQKAKDERGKPVLVLQGKNAEHACVLVRNRLMFLLGAMLEEMKL